MSEMSMYERIGGAPVVQRLADRFYDHMDSLSGAKTIRAMHASSLTASREKLFLFLSGWLGGPPLYVEKYGHPRLRMRHFPFAIDTRARDEWMLCMDSALHDVIDDPELRDALFGAFFRLADHMRNQPEAQG